MFTPSLAGPLHPYRDDHDEHEEGKAKAVLQAIRMLLASDKHGRSEVQQSENATSAPASAAAGKFQPSHV